MTFNSYAMFCRRTEAPLNSRPYAAINQFIIIIFWPRYSIPGEWKNYAMQYQKSAKNQAGMNLTPPPSSQNSYYYVNFLPQVV